jgi:hypothetical protein
LQGRKETPCLGQNKKKCGGKIQTFKNVGDLILFLGHSCQLAEIPAEKLKRGRIKISAAVKIRSLIFVKISKISKQIVE